MGAQDNLSRAQDAVRFYHGTNAELNPGDAISPKYSGRVEGSDRVTRGSVYFTSDQHAARYYGVQAALHSTRYRDQSRGPNVARVYEVEPTGPSDKDPDNQTLLGDRGAMMTQHPLRVKGLVEKRHPRSEYGIETPWHSPGEDPWDAAMKNRNRNDRLPEY